ATNAAAAFAARFVSIAGAPPAPLLGFFVAAADAGFFVSFSDAFVVFFAIIPRHHIHRHATHKPMIHSSPHDTGVIAALSASFVETFTHSHMNSFAGSGANLCACF